MSDLRFSLTQLVAAIQHAGQPATVIPAQLHREGETLFCAGRAYSLPAYRRVRLIGFGKAAATMADAVASLLAGRLTNGFLITKYDHAPPAWPWPTVKLVEAGHPLPDANSLAHTAGLLNFLADTAPTDLIICLISGGGSALLEALPAGLTLADLQTVTDQLLRAGAPIEELNMVRKHLSLVKAGQLARHLAPATTLVLILSDVLNNSLSLIASGPTSPDPTTFAETWTILARYGLDQAAPPAIIAHVQAGLAGQLPETPKPADPLFARLHHVIVADNSTVVQAAATAGEVLGFIPHLWPELILVGEARLLAGRLAPRLAALVADPRQPRPGLLILGGETTVTVTGAGLGGRNQELALALALALPPSPADYLLATLATDGGDGPTPAAGAIITPTTLARAAAAGFDPHQHLRDHNTYPFFAGLGDLIHTGPSGTNLNDLLLFLWR